MKEQEIDELLEFAYELDYEKYMEDFEVRQALALIKERVTEIAKDQDWKQKMADDWNQANAEIDAKEAKDQDKKSTAQSKYPVIMCAESHVSGASKASFNARVQEAK